MPTDAGAIDTSKYIGRHIRLLGDHPFAGDSAEVIGFDNIGMRVKLIRGDAMHGHESYVMKRENYRPERKGLDW
jgi:hypothetical protein